MHTATLIAIIIAIVILLAIWWLMTRAGRARAAARYAQDSPTADAAQRGAPDGREGTGIVTESAGSGTVAGSSPADDGKDTFAGADASGSPAHVEAPAHVAGAVAQAHDAHGHPNAGRTAVGVAVAGAVAGAAAGAAADANADASASANADASASAGAGAGAGASDAPRDGDPTRRDRPRFDPAIDGHPLPDAGTVTGSMRSPDMSQLPSARPAMTGDFSVNSGDTSADVREMLKILNLRSSDAGRLELSGEQFAALWHGRREGIDDRTLESVVGRLRRMIG